MVMEEDARLPAAGGAVHLIRNHPGSAPVPGQGWLSGAKSRIPVAGVRLPCYNHSNMQPQQKSRG